MNKKVLRMKIHLAGGTIVFLRNGKPHRANGPAVIVPKGPKYWFLYGKPHRTNGPAVIMPDETYFWHVEGQLFTFNQWLVEIETIYGGDHALYMKFKWK